MYTQVFRPIPSIDLHSSDFISDSRPSREELWSIFHIKWWRWQRTTKKTRREKQIEYSKIVVYSLKYLPMYFLMIVFDVLPFDCSLFDYYCSIVSAQPTAPKTATATTTTVPSSLWPVHNKFIRNAHFDVVPTEREFVSVKVAARFHSGTTYKQSKRTETLNAIHTEHNMP